MNNADPKRQAMLDAGLIFYRMFATTGWWPTAEMIEDPDDQMETMLRNTLKKAQESLAGYQQAKAARIALDKVLPDWVPIDASDHIPKEKWHAFVSNDKDEWLSWLKENGVPDKEAKRLVEQAWED